MKKIFFIAALQLLTVFAHAKTVRYELTITREPINLSGKKTVDWALMVNKSIPAPALEFTEGDDAEILVTNGLDNEEVSLHWHGILLPPEEDGVAYVNTPPIFAGRSRLFKFKIRQHGTYWYHSHTMVQEQKGVYGALIIHPKKPLIKADKEVVAVLSDWSDENADQIIKNLRKDGDYYLYKKDSMRSIGGAIHAGAVKTYFANEWQRMGGMDLSDVGYDAFLINGKRQLQLLNAKAGEKIRLRIINAAASSYFYVSLGGLPLKVIAADGIDIDPVEAKELLMGMAETYDILFTVPENKNYEFRATVQDVTGFASAWIGSANGEKINAVAKDAPNLYAEMDHSGMDHSTMNHHSHHGHHGDHKPQVLETLTVDELKAQSPTTLPAQAKVTELKLVLGGDMERYTWHINGKAIHEDRDILIREGDVVRFTFVNETMMHHPMHLHGHFFRVLNKNKEFSPLKHTVDVPPHGTKTIEFYANEPGQWMLHCHNLYHMKTGMARVVKYMSYKPSAEIAALEKHDPHMHEHIYNYSLLEASTNHARANFKFMTSRNELELAVESRSNSNRDFRVEGQWQTEGDLIVRRWYGNYTNLMIGASAYNDQGYGVLGAGYILPLLIESQFFINHEGRIRIDLEKRLQWTKNIFSEIEYSWRPNWDDAVDKDHEQEYEISLMYGPSWHWAAGIMLTNESYGAGVQVQF